MERKILYTSSYEDIIESVANICGCNEEHIKNYLQRLRPYKNTCASEVVITDFFKAIDVQFMGNNQLFDIIKFDACIV